MLLRMQDKLRKLETLLDGYDDEDAADDSQKELLMSRDKDEAADRKADPGTRTRTEILDEIEVVLAKYGTYTQRDIQSQCS
jgi:hypothetical protein